MVPTPVGPAVRRFVAVLPVLPVLPVLAVAVAMAAASPAASALGATEPARAAIAVEQAYAPPTATITVDGTGFGRSEHVVLSFDATVVGKAITGRTGAFSVEVRVPVSALPGDHDLGAAGKRTGRSAHTTFLVRTDWTEPRFEAAGTGSNPYENVIDATNASGLQQVWKHNSDGGESAPSIVDGVAYVSVESVGVMAIDVETQKILWTAPGGGNGTAVAGGVVYDVDEESNLRAIDAASGTVLWTFPVDRMRGSGPVVADGTVYFETGYDDTLEAVDAATGQARWNAPIGNASDADHLPAVAGEVVFVSSSAGPLLAIDASTGATDWTYSCGGTCSQPSTAEGVVFVGNAIGDLSALNATNGAVEWDVHLTNHGVIAGAAIAGGVVYASIDVGGKTDHVVAVDAATGSILWDAPAYYHYPAPPVVADGVVYDWSRSRNDVDAYDASNGALLWSTHLPNSGGVAGVVVADGTMYAASQSGLRAFRVP